MVMQSGHTALT